jgi:t-SNARE syntaxin family protein
VSYSPQLQAPILTDCRDVLSALYTARPLFKSYLRIRSSASSANSPELRDARNELEQTLQDLGQDLEDLVESVKAVEHDPYRFGLEIDEVERRRRLVKDVGDEIAKMRDELQHTIQDARNTGQAAANGDMLPDPDAFEDDDTYAAFEQERQVEMMHDQDEALDGVFRTVGNLRQQADDMGRELEEQGELLNDVDNVADRVGGKLQTGLKKVGWVIRKNEGMIDRQTQRIWLTCLQIHGLAAALHSSSLFSYCSWFCSLSSERGAPQRFKPSVARQRASPIMDYPRLLPSGLRPTITMLHCPAWANCNMILEVCVTKRF